MRSLTLAAIVATALLAQGCWVGHRGRGYRQPVAHYQRDERPAPRAPRDDHRRDDWDHRDDRR